MTDPRCADCGSPCAGDWCECPPTCDGVRRTEARHPYEGVDDLTFNAWKRSRGHSITRIPAPGTNLNERADQLARRCRVPWLAAFDSLAVLDVLSRDNEAIGEALADWWEAA